MKQSKIEKDFSSNLLVPATAKQFVKVTAPKFASVPCTSTIQSTSRGVIVGAEEGAESW